MNGRYVTVYCLLPWIVLGLVKVLYAMAFEPQLPAQVVTYIACAMWMVISPAISALVILVTYREGQWSKDDELIKLETENAALVKENARLKANCGVFQFD